MRNTIKILHPTDLSVHAREGFRLALRLSKQLNARLDILHVAPTFGEDPLRNAYDVSIDEKKFYGSLIEEIDGKLVAMQEAEDAVGLEIRRVHARGNSPADVILEYAKKQQINLIVMGTHGYRGLKKMLLGSTTLEVIHSAPCDILTVNADALNADVLNTDALDANLDRKNTILVPLDLGVHSRPLLASAIALAGQLHYSLHLVHILETTFVPAPGLNASDLYQLLPSRRKEAETMMQQLLDELDPEITKSGASVEVTFKEGHPSKEIIQLSKNTNCSLVMLEPSAMNWFERFPLGSVTEYIIAHASCPVYVKPANREISIQENIEEPDTSAHY